MSNPYSPPTVVFDFDGVINSYKSGWVSESLVPDPPVEGIKEAISQLRERGYRIVVTSSRAQNWGGYKAIRDYLDKYEIKVDEVTFTKPPALVYVDDRAICFSGDCKDLIQKITTFKPWWKE